MILNSAGPFSCFALALRFYVSYIIFTSAPIIRNPAPTQSWSESKNKRAGGFIRRPSGRLAHLGSLVHCASSVAQTVVFGLPVESPNRAGILTRSGASNPCASLISHRKAERLNRRLTSKGCHWLRFLTGTSGELRPALFLAPDIVYA